MRKNYIFLVFISFILALLLNFFQSSNALYLGFSPEFYPGNKEYGLGVYFAPKELKLYSEADLNSLPVEEIKWNTQRVQLYTTNNTVENPEDAFISFWPYRDVALMAVIDDKEEWIKVIYNHPKNLSGWVHLNKQDDSTTGSVGKFYTWLEFMQNIAAYRGIYSLKDVPRKNKKLFTAPDDDAKHVKFEDGSYSRFELRIVKGNWMLVKATGFNNAAPIGWMRWRDDNGKLMIFCNMDQ